MITWNNLDTLTSYQELEKTARVNLAEVMTGAKRRRARAKNTVCRWQRDLFTTMQQSR